MDLGLAGKTVIVTGGGSNIGRAISLTFAGEKSNVVIAEIDQAQGNKIAQEGHKLGGKCLCIRTDVTDWDSVQAMVKKAAETFGTVDILVNNVGWTFERLFIEKAREVGRYNIRLNVVCPGTTMPDKPEEVGAQSMWGPSGFGATWNTPEMRERIAKAYPLRRLGSAQDIGKAVAFLASDAANYITGQTLSVSGGYTMM